MTILGFELSSRTGSMAVLSGGRIQAERSWNEAAATRQRLFAVLPDLLVEAKTTLPEIDVFAVGLGPGSFSGLRIALMAARGMAMPGNKPVYGVSSAEALAWDVRIEAGEKPVVTVGDARRNRFWYAVFLPFDSKSEPSPAIHLVAPADLPSVIPPRTVVVTPEWERTGRELGRCSSDGITLIQESRAPTAKAVAHLVERKLQMGIPSDPLAPIYLHPAVAAR